jgi:hypothetical protein
MLPSRPAPRGLLAAVLLLALLPGPLLAQSASDSGGESEGDNDDEGPTVVSVGNLTTDFSYGRAIARGGAYNYQKNVRALMISGPGGSFLVDYASNLGGRGPEQETRRTIGAEALFGGNVYLFRDFLFLPFSVYVPIRANLDYRYVQPTDASRSNLHRGAAGLGAGAGGQLRLPVGPDFIQENVLVRGTAVLVPGITSSFGGSDPDELVNPEGSPVSTSATRMRRAINLNLEILFDDLLGGDTGVMAGYTLQATGHSAERPSSVGDVIDAATLYGDYTKVSEQHKVRVGLTW